jgi:hypothetical protein
MYLPSVSEFTAILKALPMIRAIKPWRKKRWPERFLQIEFDANEMVVDDSDIPLRTVRIKIVNLDNLSLHGVWAKIDRIDASNATSAAGRQTAKEFNGHPLRRTRDFKNSHSDAFDLPAGDSDEVLLAFWKGATAEERDRVYFSAIWSKYQFGEAYLPRDNYTIHVAVGAEGLPPVRKAFYIAPSADGRIVVAEAKLTRTEQLDRTRTQIG